MQRTTNPACLTDLPAEPSFSQYGDLTDFLSSPLKIRHEILYLVVHVDPFHFFVRKRNCSEIKEKVTMQCGTACRQSAAIMHDS